MCSYCSSKRHAVLLMSFSLLFLALGEVSESLAGGKDGTVGQTKQFFEQHGFDPSLFPRGDFGTAEIDPLLMRWETVRPGLENLLQKNLALTARPDLSLHFLWVNRPNAPKRLRVIFRTPGDGRVKQYLKDVLGVQPDAFDEIELAPESELIMWDEFRPRYISGGDLNLQIIHEDLKKLFSELSCCLDAHVGPNILRGFYPVHPEEGFRLEETSPGMTNRELLVRTTWNNFVTGHNTLFYRFEIALELLTPESWRLNTRLEVGEKLPESSAVTPIGQRLTDPEWPPTFAALKTRDRCVVEWKKRVTGSKGEYIYPLDVSSDLKRNAGVLFYLCCALLTGQEDCLSEGMRQAILGVGDLPTDCCEVLWPDD